MLKNLMIKDFIEELSSSSPAPGGGSIAALAGALGSALGSMVFNLTVNKKDFNLYNEDDKSKVNGALEKFQIEKSQFIDLMERDTEAFLELMNAFRLPKNIEEEKIVRSERIQQGYRKSIEVPLEVSKKAFKMYDYMLIACELGNNNAITDAGVATLLLQTAIEGAVLNVKINLTSLKDEEYKEKVRSDIEKLVLEGRIKRDDIMSIVNSKII